MSTWNFHRDAAKQIRSWPVKHDKLSFTSRLAMNKNKTAHKDISHKLPFKPTEEETNGFPVASDSHLFDWPVVSSRRMAMWWTGWNQSVTEKKAWSFVFFLPVFLGGRGGGGGGSASVPNSDPSLISASQASAFSSPPAGFQGLQAMPRRFLSSTGWGSRWRSLAELCKTMGKPGVKFQNLNIRETNPCKSKFGHTFLLPARHGGRER